MKVYPHDLSIRKPLFVTWFGPLYLLGMGICFLYAASSIPNETVAVILLCVSAIVWIALYFLTKNNVAKSKIRYLRDLSSDSFIWHINNYSDYQIYDGMEEREIFEKIKGKMVEYYNQWFIYQRVFDEYPKEILLFSKEEFVYVQIIPFIYSEIRADEAAIWDESQKTPVEKNGTITGYSIPLTQKGKILYGLLYNDVSTLISLYYRHKKAKYLWYAKCGEYEYEKIANYLSKGRYVSSDGSIIS